MAAACTFAAWSRGPPPGTRRQVAEPRPDRRLRRGSSGPVDSAGGGRFASPCLLGQRHRCEAGPPWCRAPPADAY
ncbi:hypothetical protein NDU88_002832 [Pleurodeles waltl]|uniref:Uncharacterized protein n=1 Tax=Pleurodeles waltl TaxID=8319 RepID=A0AAV7W3A0_PLEWA|nr:hypothetical protein NDU88_002832 [Pleurodeles waltl]